MRKTALTSEAKRIVYCHCTHGRVTSAEVRREVLERLASSKAAFEAVPDLCEMSARRDPRLKRMAEPGGLRIAACFPRAVKWLFYAGGAPLPDEGVELLNMWEQSAEQIIRRLLPESGERQGHSLVTRLDGVDLRVILHEGPGSRPLTDGERYQTLVSLLDAGYPVTCAAKADGVVPEDSSAVAVARQVGAEAGVKKPGAWKPWFPVIDHDRCTNCAGCLSFCLFGVFGTDPGGRVRVQSPQKCKPQCPACARVCPGSAIIFPKYKDGFIGGGLVSQEDLDRKPVKADVSALLGGDGYAALRKRGAEARKRFSTERNDSQALAERRRWLEKMRDELGIPDGLLAECSAVDDLQRLVQRAEVRLGERQAGGRADGDRRPEASAEEWGI